MDEEKKARDPFVVDKPDPRAVFREEHEKRRLRLAEANKDAMAEAKKRYEELLENGKKKSMGSRAVPEKTIPPPHQE